MHRGVGELVLERVGLDDRSARAGRAGPDELGEVRLAALGEDRSVAGEIFTDRAGEDGARTRIPIEGRCPGHEPGDVLLLHRQRPCEPFPHHPVPGELLDDRDEVVAARRRADVAVDGEVDRAAGAGPVGRGRRCQRRDHLGDGVRLPCGDAEHRGQEVARAPRLEQLARRAPAVPRSEALRRTGDAFVGERPIVEVAADLEIGRLPRHDGRILHRQPGEGCRGQVIVADQLRGELVHEVDPPGKVGGIDDLVDLRRQPPPVDRLEDGAEQLLSECADRDRLPAPFPGEHENVDRRDASQRDPGIGNLDALGAVGIDDQQHVLRSTPGPGREGDDGDEEGQEELGGPAPPPPRSPGHRLPAGNRPAQGPIPEPEERGIVGASP